MGLTMPVLFRLAACEHRYASAATFDQARADFERAWRAFLSGRTDADFRAWRDERDWTEEKYRPFARGERMPPAWRRPADV